MGTYAPLGNPMMRRMEHRCSIDAIFCIFGMLLLLLLSQPTSGKSTMGTATRSANRQQLVQKATTAKTATPKGGKRQLERQLSKSPTSVDVKTILADINLPQTRFENVLTVLSHAVGKEQRDGG
jgi:hypothetical protein